MKIKKTLLSVIIMLSAFNGYARVSTIDQIENSIQQIEGLLEANLDVKNKFLKRLEDCKKERLVYLLGEVDNTKTESYLSELNQKLENLAFDISSFKKNNESRDIPNKRKK